MKAALLKRAIASSNLVPASIFEGFRLSACVRDRSKPAPSVKLQLIPLDDGW